MNHSLFGHLAYSFSASPENLATEALAYVLYTSDAARQGLAKVLVHAGLGDDHELRFTTQVTGEEGDRPDLVGRDKEGYERVIIEAKFWAGLTDNQPVQYISRIGSARSGLVLFIAPKARFNSLWPELLRRCETDKLLLSGAIEEHLGTDHTRVRLNESRWLSVISWHQLITILNEACSSRNDLDGRMNLEQLRGLCDKMEAEGFLPIRAEELAPTIPRRVIQFSELATQVVERAIARKIAQRAVGKNVVWSDGIRWCPLSLKGNNAYSVCTRRFGARPARRLCGSASRAQSGEHQPLTSHSASVKPR